MLACSIRRSGSSRLQILTIEDLFAGKKPAMPPEDPAAFTRSGALSLAVSRLLRRHSQGFTNSLAQIPRRAASAAASSST